MPVYHVHPMDNRESVKVAYVFAIDPH